VGDWRDTFWLGPTRWTRSHPWLWAWFGAAVWAGIAVAETHHWWIWLLAGTLGYLTVGVAARLGTTPPPVNPPRRRRH
jgi:hypothetical protein